MPVNNGIRNLVDEDGSLKAKAMEELLKGAEAVDAKCTDSVQKQAIETKDYDKDLKDRQLKNNKAFYYPDHH